MNKGNLCRKVNFDELAQTDGGGFVGHFNNVIPIRPSKKESVVILGRSYDTECLEALIKALLFDLLIDKKALAQYLAVSVRTVDNLMKDGLPHHPLKRRVCFRLSEVKEWLLSRRLP